VIRSAATVIGMPGALLAQLLLLACAATPADAPVVISNPGLSSWQTRELLPEIELPRNATVVIYLHGTKNPVNREDCQYRNNRVPETVQSVERMPNTLLFYLCSQAVDGNLEGSYIEKRGAEIRQVLDKLTDAGIEPGNIFLAGHSAGAWAGLMLFADDSDRFNALIGFAPECCGRRDLEADYPRWRSSIRPRQIARMLDAERIDALLFAYDDDMYNRPVELQFLPATYPGSVKLVGYNCAGGHNTHIDDCRADTTAALIQTFIQERKAGD
jgi:pimeloyl-ACP methyl ester carboxylesterase